MADFADDASAVEELQREAALSAHRINRDAVSATHCAECGTSIPDERRKAIPGVELCFYCAEDAEKKSKHVRRAV
ncbi:MAG: TraR/DksA C4-type zinc finger protein [Leclercia adecarboxylata]|nr:TraR/DksA C4-type zinc finger protein [Leclercia adecarboxylata]